MTLADIYETLSYGELSQVFLGNSGTDPDGIKKCDYKRMFSHVKMGITALHKRFLLKEGTLILGLEEGMTRYVIDPKFAVSNVRSTEPVKYILDAVSPYQNDLLKIERVYDAAGIELPINTLDNPRSLRTPDFRTLEVPADLDTEHLVVKYRADHPAIDPHLANAVPLTVDIQLPPSHVEALLLFVASRVLNPIGMVAEFHEGNSYAARYEQACLALENQGYQVNTVGENFRLIRNGWV